MAGRSWLMDGNRIATKIKNASISTIPRNVEWESNPTRHCPNCNHIIDNNDVVDEWPGLPRGVKFDPTDQEIIWHLLAKVGLLGLKPHPFINEFIPTVDEDDGICYAHPKNLPGVKQDGTVTHFFHRSIKAYSTGTRKRRKIKDDDELCDVRWHKTGRTKPVIMDGVQRGCKKIMVLYGGKSCKTNWVMHQYHLGIEEDEKNGEYVVSKIFYQQPTMKQSGKAEEDVFVMTPKAVPVTPKLVTPEPLAAAYEAPLAMVMNDEDLNASVNQARPEYECESGKRGNEEEEEEKEEEEDVKWWDSGSQYILNSQQLVEALSLCDDLLQSQSPKRGEENRDDEDERKNKGCLSDYAQLGTDDFKQDLEECQNLDFDPSNIELDTLPDFRLSQLEFGSQESFLAWGGGKAND